MNTGGHPTLVSETRIFEIGRVMLHGLNSKTSMHGALWTWHDVCDVAIVASGGAVGFCGPANIHFMTFGAIQLRCYDLLGRPRSTLSILGSFSVDVRVFGTSQCRPYGFWIGSLSMR